MSEMIAPAFKKRRRADAEASAPEIDASDMSNESSNLT